MSQDNGNQSAGTEREDWLALPTTYGAPVLCDLTVSDVSRIVPRSKRDGGGSVVIFRDGGREHIALESDEVARLVTEKRVALGMFDDPDGEAADV